MSVINDKKENLKENKKQKSKYVKWHFDGYAYHVTKRTMSGTKM